MTPQLLHNRHFTNKTIFNSKRDNTPPHTEIRERKHTRELGGLPSLTIRGKLPLYPESGKTKKSLGNKELSWPARDMALIIENTSRDQVIKSGVDWFEICEDRHLRASVTMYFLTGH